MSCQRTKEIQTSIINSAVTLSQSLSTSLGPRGSDKMIVKDKKTLITNDGATILKSLSYNHPINAILSNLSQTQDKNCGDGTTSVVVLTGSILKKCQNLLDKNIHPSLICKSLQKIKKISEEYIESIKIHIGDKKLNKEKYKMYVNEPIKANTNITNELHKYRDSLLKSVVTALSSKIISLSAIEYAPIAVDSVLMVNGAIQNIKVAKKIGGSVEDVCLVEAIVLNENIKNQILKNNQDTYKAKVNLAILQFCVSPPKTNIDSKININDHILMERIIKEEREYLLNICKKIKKSGADLVLVQKSILREGMNELALHFLTKMNVLVIDDISREDIQFLCNKLEMNASVDCDAIEIKEFVIEETKENEALITKIMCKKGCSIVVRGSDKLIVDEAERSLHDALCVVRCLFEDPYLLPGGGAVEMGIAQKLRNTTIDIENEIYTEQYILNEIGLAFEEIPYYLARNAGFNSIEAINEMRNKIKDNANLGVNVRVNTIGCMLEENIVQPIKVSRSAISLAIETVTMILKIDDILPAVQ
ncbi:T-complex protein 1 subunit delta [Binucleata daphniae]